MNGSTRAGLYILSVIGAMALGACGDEDATGPTTYDQEIDAELAMIAADGTIEDVYALQGPQDGGAFMQDRSGSRTVQFFDAAGVEQAAYDAMTTDSIFMTMEMSQEITRTDWSASVTRTREMSVSGLEGMETTRTVNGTGTEEVHRSRDPVGPGFRELTMVGSRTMEDVVHAVPLAENPWPLSGTITRVMTVTVTTEQGTRTHTREVVVTFNGTQFPEMMIDGEPFEVDLAAGPHAMPFHDGRPHGPEGPGDANLD